KELTLLLGRFKAWIAVIHLKISALTTQLKAPRRGTKTQKLKIVLSAYFAHLTGRFYRCVL
ncbi:hypothetical protein, partial [Enterobacter hormaechei]|uniref:hypothetical protein n=1 Tax=Enterobacter hormaechei TaxID=158836 RepID=UPI001CC27744